MTENKRFGDDVGGWTVPPRPEPFEMKGDFVALERLNADLHAADLHGANSVDDALWDYLPYGPFPSAADYLRWARSVEEKDDPYFYAVRDLKNGHVCGVLSFLRISPEAGGIEIGHINFAPELQKTRAATEAFYLAMEWAFEAGYRRFEWKCDANNIPSRRAAQRLGLSYEGVFRQAAIVKGKNRDTVWFAAIDKEWPALREAYKTWLAPQNFSESGAQIISLKDLTGIVRASSDPVLK
ncbi:MULTISPECIES: GNAT family N-acetyltransferase [Falsihalocynthiibacter]|uniref:GNAT family N-acetyltransferase n=1 Tax=Falsihalocynthiibacter TaxID=2854182 RepID=UPI00300259DE